VEVFFVICDLDDERHMERFLEVFAEDEGQHVSEVQGLRRWAAASIDIKGRDGRVAE
jgi:hypothetical protein